MNLRRMMILILLVAGGCANDPLPFAFEPLRPGADGMQAPSDGQATPAVPDWIPATADCPAARARSVLIDGSHDGGAWWSPQGVGRYDPAQPHQGKAIADFLRSRGYAVTELNRHAPPDRDQLLGHAIVISAGGVEVRDYPAWAGWVPDFTDADFANWQQLARCPRTILLLHDYLWPFSHDRLSAALGVPLTGQEYGTVGNFVPHPITAGLSGFELNAGSWLADGHDPDIKVLGHVAGTDVMGVIERGSSKLFFMTDINGIESMPDHLWENLIAWGF